jgi:transcriptional regulator with XRE-family HTH domain
MEKRRGPKTIGGVGQRRGAAVKTELLAYRLKAGFSQRKLAELTGLSVMAIWQYETGRNFPAPKKMFLLSYLLGAAVGDIWPELRKEALFREVGLL